MWYDRAMPAPGLDPQPVPVLEYRPDRPAITLRDPMLALVPFAVGAAIGGAAGVLPILLYGGHVPRDRFFGFSIAGGIAVFAIATGFLALAIMFRCKLSRDVLSARPPSTRFLLGLTLGALSFPVAFPLYFVCNQPPDPHRFMPFFPPSPR